MRKVTLLGAWVVVVVVTTALTWQIVGAADAQVGERPVSPLNVAAPAPDPDVQPSTTAASSVDTSTTFPAGTIPETPDTTAPSSTTTSGTPTPSVSTTTTTEAAAGWSLKNVSTEGGVVVLKYRPGEVVLQTATPSPGFRAEVEDPGPPEVEVEFETDQVKIEVHAKWDGDDIRVEISESTEDGDD